MAVFAALCAVTVLSAAAVSLLPWLALPVRRLLALRLSASATPAPSAARVLALAAHNLPVAGWPLLLGAAGADRSSRGRRLANLLVSASLAANAVLVGAAFGGYGLRLAVFVPQLPCEWAALALGATGWLLRLNEQRSSGWTAGLLVALVLAAAALETFAVPHRHELGGVAGGASRRLTGVSESAGTGSRPEEHGHGRRQHDQHAPAA